MNIKERTMLTITITELDDRMKYGIGHLIAYRGDIYQIIHIKNGLDYIVLYCELVFRCTNIYYINKRGTNIMKIFDLNESCKD